MERINGFSSARITGPDEPDLIRMHVREMDETELRKYQREIERELLRRERIAGQQTLTFDRIKLCDPDA